MSENQAIIYVHYGPLPRYLLHTIENSRVFNPQTPIYVIGDHFNHRLHKFSVQFVSFSELETKEHRFFLKNYEHISTESVTFERFCIIRWFHMWQLMRKYGIQQAIHCDSDCFLFTNTDSLHEQLSLFDLTTAQGGCPHFALIHRPLDDLIQYCLSVFSDKTGLAQRKEQWQFSVESVGPAANLNDMRVISEYTQMSESCAFYDDLPPMDGVFERGIALSDGYEMHRKTHWKGTGLLTHAKEIFYSHFWPGFKRRLAAS